MDIADTAGTSIADTAPVNIADTAAGGGGVAGPVLFNSHYQNQGWL